MEGRGPDGGVLVGASVIDVGGGQNVCSAGSGEYAGVFGGGGLLSSPCWSSESSRNSMFRNVRLVISHVDNASLLSSLPVDGKGVVVGSEGYVGVGGVEG